VREVGKSESREVRKKGSMKVIKKLKVEMPIKINMNAKH